MEECGYCKEKEKKIRCYEDEIEKEKARECLRALEREKIAKGMLSTKRDEINLREMQRLQMQEKRLIEKEKEYKDWMWHQVLLDDVTRKEQYELMEAQRKHQEMLERRRTYDEQIASANRKRQQAMQEEREKENRRLERMTKKMEQDHYEAIRRKKEQQMTNKKNFIEGHEIKLSRLREEKMRNRVIDDGTIRVALEGLRKDREQQKIQMRSLQMEKQICIENYTQERRLASSMKEEVDRISEEWKRMAEGKTDEHIRQVEAEKLALKEKASKEYQQYIEQLRKQNEEEKLERAEQNERVKRAAYKELHTKLYDADTEILKQMEYRNILTEQIRDNQRHVESQLLEIDLKDKAFTKPAIMFKDAMDKKLGLTQGRQSTNPVHPFRRLMKSKQNSLQLPIIR